MSSDPELEATFPLRGEKIGFLGLGKMGFPMAKNLVEAGFVVQGFDLSESAQLKFDELGGASVGSPKDAAKGADVLILMLPTSDAVESVFADAELLSALTPGMIVMDMGSSEPLRTRALEASLAKLGIHMIDAPVSGGVSRANSGTLAIMAGGPTEIVGRVKPILDRLGKVTEVGPVGSGHALKALNNLLSATHLLATCEAMLVGEKFGLDKEIMLTVFNESSGRSASTENKWPNFILSEKFNSGFGLRLMLKDMNIATNLAENLGVTDQLAITAARLWAEASETLPPDADHTEIHRWVEGSEAG